MLQRSTLLAALLGVVLCAGTSLQARADSASGKTVKVFILLGQSNMVGLGQVDGVSNSKSLEHAVKVDHLYPWLVDKSGDWTVEKNCRFVHYMMNRITYNQWLSPKGHKHMGPEFGIGHEVMKVENGPVMLLKSCIGNRSLGWDLLPPGSKGYVYNGYQYAGYKQSPGKWKAGTTPPNKGGWYAGKEYDMDIAGAKSVLNNLGQYYPGATKYKVVGFFFWQGDKDRYNAAYASHYEQNLVNFIKSVRKDFSAPKAPFVIATLGQDTPHSKGNDLMILKAQVDVANPQKYPQFKGNVATVYSHPLSKGGSSSGHYNHEAQTYMNVGMAMGEAMDKLLKNK